jgi:hypothetical protein
VELIFLVCICSKFCRSLRDVVERWMSRNWHGILVSKAGDAWTSTPIDYHRHPVDNEAPTVYTQLQTKARRRYHHNAKWTKKFWEASEHVAQKSSSHLISKQQLAKGSQYAIRLVLVPDAPEPSKIALNPLKFLAILYESGYITRWVNVSADFMRFRLLSLSGILPPTSDET